ncbi:MAG: hypothetical protein ACYCYF_05150 [Anaerolineae bacterium]
MDEQAQFLEAERQFRWYTAEAQAGRLDAAAYRAAINAIRVTDAQGRMWMLQEGSGAWHLWLGDRWIAAAPYAVPPPVAAVEAPMAAAPHPQPIRSDPTRATASQDVSETTDGAGCMGQAIKYALISLVIFGVIGAALILFVEDFPPEGLLGIGLAAIISIIISVRTLSKHWEGEIVNLHTERVDVSSGDDDPEYRDVLFADIRQASGKLRKERALPGWKVGDRLRKRQGQMNIEHLG